MDRARRSLTLAITFTVALSMLPRALSPCSNQARAGGPVTDGVTWLESNQNPSGSWGTSSQLIDTCTVIEALTAIDPQSPAITTAAAWLSAQPSANHRFLARKIAALASVPGYETTVDALVADLLAAKNPVEFDTGLPNWPEGGWGIAPAYGTDCLTTSLALHAIERAGLGGGFALANASVAAGASNQHEWTIPNDAQTARLLIVVTGAQVNVRMTAGTPPTPSDPYFPLPPGTWLLTFPDSGLPFAAGTNTIDIASAGSAAGYSIEASYETATFDTRTLLEPLDYLREAQNGDGSWGVQRGSDAEIYSTLNVLSALLDHGTYDEDVRADGVAYLTTQQLGDGSYGFAGSGVSYITAMAVKVHVRHESYPFVTTTNDAVTALLLQQDVGGSWDFESHHTAHGALALWCHDQAPSADAGPDQDLSDSGGDCTEAVTLSGGGTDVDGTIIDYRWTESGVEIATGTAPTINLEPGSHVITLTVTDDGGRRGADTMRIDIGRVTILSEALDTDPTWIEEGSWDWGVPLGVGGDPTAGCTGSNVIGYNLSGAYGASQAAAALTIPTIDLSGYYQIRLRFCRWLTVQDSRFDGAAIQTSIDGRVWNTIWEHQGPAVLDREWLPQEFDLSMLDNQPFAAIRWLMGPTDASIELGGWNLDDIEIVGVPIGGPACPCDPVTTLGCVSAGSDIVLNWVNGSGYGTIDIYRDGVLLDTTPGTQTSYEDLDIASGSYTYGLIGHCGGGVDSTTTECTVVHDIPCDHVTELSCASDEADIVLNWTNVDSYSAIDVYRDGVSLATISGTATSYTDPSVPFDATYTYTVVGDCSGVPAGGVDCSILHEDICFEVTGLTCGSQPAGVDLAWVVGEPYATIDVERDGAVIASLAGSATSYTDGGVAIGSYTYGIVGHCPTGSTAPTVECSVVHTTPCEQVTSFTCTSVGEDVELAWTDGASYDGVDIYRDGSLIATLVGSPGTHTDLDVETGSHVYEIQGHCGSYTTLLVSCTLDHINPCDAITGLMCSVLGAEVTLEWTNSESYSSLNIYRDGTLIGSLAGTATSFVDSPAPDGAHTYGVEAICLGVASASVECSISVVPCGPVTGVTCESMLEDVDLAWTNGDAYIGINVYRNGSLIGSLPGAATSTVDVGVAGGTYTYTIEGVCAGGQPAAGATCSLTHPGLCQAVTGLTCNSVAIDVVLAWSAAESYASIEIERNGVSIATISGSATSYTDVDAPSGTHTYAVIATCPFGAVAPSSECTLTHENPCEGVTGVVCLDLSDEILVTWTLGDSYATIEIRRNGTPIATVAGTATAYTDQPPTGPYTYDIIGQCADGGVAPTGQCTVSHVAPCLAVSDLACVSSEADVTLTWTNGDAYTDIEIQRSGVPIATLAGSATSYTDSGLAAGVYEYDVIGVCTGGTAAIATSCQVSHAGVCDPVTSVECTSIGADIEVSWALGGSYTSIHIFRDGAPIGSISGTATNYVDAGVATGSYVYTVEAECPLGAVAPGVTCMIDHVTPCAPLTALTCLSLGEAVILDWTNGDAYQEIQIERDSVLIATLPGTTDFYQDPAPAGTYTYSITGFCVGAVPAPSSECTVTHTPPCTAVSALSCTTSDADVLLGWTLEDAYDAIEVYRDDVLLETLAGGVTMTVDVDVATGDYTYAVVGICSTGAAPATECTLTHLAPCDPVTDVTCLSMGSDVVLSWLNGESYLAINIYRDDVEIDTVFGTDTTFTDAGVPGGTYTYTIEPICDGPVFALGVDCIVEHAGLPDFRRGDCNVDGAMDISDAIFGLGVLFSSGGPPLCDDSCDANDDGNIDIADMVYLLSALFSGGPPPAAPGATCGTDPTADGLTCELYDVCP